MAQDLRDLYRKEQCEEGFAMIEGHEKRFKRLLEKELPHIVCQ